MFSLSPPSVSQCLLLYLWGEESLQDISYLTQDTYFSSFTSCHLPHRGLKHSFLHWFFLCHGKIGSSTSALGCPCLPYQLHLLSLPQRMCRTLCLTSLLEGFPSASSIHSSAHHLIRSVMPAVLKTQPLQATLPSASYPLRYLYVSCSLRRDLLLPVWRM